jgi:hypothetical protein
MDLIALSGPCYAGKSSLAIELETHRYMRLLFSDILKIYTVRMMKTIGEDLTLEKLADPLIKAKYRGFLQELGVVLNIDNDPKCVIPQIR